MVIWEVRCEYVDVFIVSLYQIGLYLLVYDFVVGIVVVGEYVEMVDVVGLRRSSDGLAEGEWIVEFLEDAVAVGVLE